MALICGSNGSPLKSPTTKGRLQSVGRPRSISVTFIISRVSPWGSSKATKEHSWKTSRTAVCQLLCTGGTPPLAHGKGSPHSRRLPPKRIKRPPLFSLDVQECGAYRRTRWIANPAEGPLNEKSTHHQTIFPLTHSLTHSLNPLTDSPSTPPIGTPSLPTRPRGDRRPVFSRNLASRSLVARSPSSPPPRRRRRRRRRPRRRPPRYARRSPLSLPKPLPGPLPRPRRSRRPSPSPFPFSCRSSTFLLLILISLSLSRRSRLCRPFHWFSLVLPPPPPPPNAGCRYHR